MPSELRARGGNTDQLRRWVHCHSDTSPPRPGGRSAGSQGGVSMIKSKSLGYRVSLGESSIGVRVGEGVGWMGKVV